MNFLTGRWRRRSLLVCRYLYDPLRDLQLRLAVRSSSLVLLKGRNLCRDYGAGRPHVKYFLDAAFSERHVASKSDLALKLVSLEDIERPLELVYFGRLTAYKGVDRCVEAVALASKLTTAPLRLHVIGGGEQEAELKALAARLELGDRVQFHAAVPFGPRLFEALRPMHLLLAAPLSEDTPRSALDAMACGIPVLAFDTNYYSELRESGAVDLVPWPSVERLAERIADYADDKRLLTPLVRSAVAFARANTQEAWLQARADWTMALFDGERGRIAAAASGAR
jgi:glycosyltransferase involved in cell wall biosynthesis